MSNTIFFVICGFVFFMLNEFEDESVRNTWPKRFDFLNQRWSLRRKWLFVNNETIVYVPQYYTVKVFGKTFNLPSQWWYFGIYPEYVEKFTYSSTVLVFLTDPEHAFQFAKLRVIELALLVVHWQVFLGWFIGIRAFAFYKERFLKSIH